MITIRLNDQLEFGLKFERRFSELMSELPLPLEAFDELKSAGLHEMPLPWFHQVQCVLWPEKATPHDILTSEEVSVICENYRRGGSVRELAKKFWEAQAAVRISGEVQTPDKVKNSEAEG
ncbi:unnamed protein product [Symbiodinium sp. CCMP2592]|nr:unnamed protein product [Symbiodinium sp. CCMP2592]